MPATVIETTELDRLKTFSGVVADTSDFGSIKAFAPQDSTTKLEAIIAEKRK